jgi:hypothetical protein
MYLIYMHLNPEQFGGIELQAAEYSIGIRSYIVPVLDNGVVNINYPNLEFDVINSYMWNYVSEYLVLRGTDNSGKDCSFRIEYYPDLGTIGTLTIRFREDIEYQSLMTYGGWTSTNPSLMGGSAGITYIDSRNIQINQLMTDYFLEDSPTLTSKVTVQTDLGVIFEGQITEYEKSQLLNGYDVTIYMTKS